MEPDQSAGLEPSGYLPEFTRFDHSQRLDGIRGLAIVMVLIGHLQDTQLAPLGVVIFFGLSGYLITSLLMAERNRSGTIRLKLFYGRRVLRLYPALLCFLLVILVLRPLGLQPGLPMLSWFASLLYLRNIVGHGVVTNHLWSLSMEEQFYLFWPLLLYRFRARQLAYITTLLIVAVTCIRTVLMLRGETRWFIGNFYQGPLHRMDSILVGCLLALVAQSVWSVPIAAFFRRISGVVLLLLLPAVMIAWSLLVPDHSVCFITVQVILSTCWLAVVVFSRMNFVIRLLDTRILGWFGKYSYSIYLWQQLFTIVKPPFVGVFTHAPWNLVASIALGILSRHVVEEPFLKLKDKLSTQHAQLVS